MSVSYSNQQIAEKVNEMCVIINTERTVLGLQPLYCVPYLMDCADIRANEASECWGHYRPNGDYFTEIIDYKVVQYSNIFENLAAGSDTASATMEQFRNSSPHWKTIVNPDITHMGVGLCYNPDGVGNANWYWCQIFTNDFREGYEYEGQYLPAPTNIGKITLNCINTETGENFSGLSVTIRRNDNIKVDLSEVKIMQNDIEINFNISADEKSIYFTTGNSPTKITMLPSGNYYLEITPPRGYYSNDLLSTSDCYYTYFRMKNDGSEIPDITLNLTKIKLSILKTDAGTDNTLADAVLKIWGSSSLAEVEVSQPCSLSDNKLAITFTTGNEPVQFVKIPSGDYYLKEILAPSGYILSDTQKKISVSSRYQTSPFVEKNSPTTVTFTKIGQGADGTQSNLSGAELKLYFKGDESIANVRSVQEISINQSEKSFTWISSDTPLTIYGLPFGWYELHEISCPDDFEQAEIITFKLDSTGTVTDAVNTFGEVINNNIKIYSRISPLKTVFQHDYITIYDFNTKQDKFDRHGLGVLTPSECLITEYHNGKYELSITHPVDSDNKYQYIKENNIIKALGQLFTLKTVTHSYSSTRNEVKGSAEHIFYQQNDWWILPDASRIMFIPQNSVLNLLDNIDAFASKYFVEGQTYYSFDWDSDLTIPADFPLREFPNSDGTSPVGVIMEQGGILEVSKGELYRDNFYFSIKERMENSNDNAFEIRIGKNLRGIKRTVDLTTVCTFFWAYDNYGNVFGVSWGENYGLNTGPHNIIRSKRFVYTFDDENMSDYDKAVKAFEMLATDALQFFDTHCKPLISIEVDLEDVQNNPDFIEFSNKPDYRVGNIGIIYDERIGGKIKLKITKTIKDALTGKTKTVLFGSNRSLTGNPAYTSAVMDMNPVIKSQSFHIMDSSGAFVYDSENNPIIQEVNYD